MITPVGPAVPARIAPVERSAPAAGGADFGEVLRRAVGAVDELQRDASRAAVTLASGGSVDLARTVVAIEKANVSLQLAVQVRNKLLEAYQELMRMSV